MGYDPEYLKNMFPNGAHWAQVKSKEAPEAGVPVCTSTSKGHCSSGDPPLVTPNQQAAPDIHYTDKVFPKGAHWGTGVKDASLVQEKPEEKDKNAGAAPTKAEETKKADAEKKPGHFEPAAKDMHDSKPASKPICNGRN